uniref:Dynein axonemal light chain 1 n=1 Tax=Cacopsylla melanoneura TaxID=428564 RepID=A0A8D9FG92_9HEMI
MSGKIPLKEALKKWNEENPDTPLKEAKDIGLQFRNIDKMDNSTLFIPNVEKLSLSTNSIEKIAGLQNLKSLKILALGRNQIKSFSGLEHVGGTLEELWISYNIIQNTKGIGALKVLKVLSMCNNLVKDWAEFARLNECPELVDLVFVGNPLVEPLEYDVYRLEVKTRVPQLKKLDGEVLPSM